MFNSSDITELAVTLRSTTKDADILAFNFPQFLRGYLNAQLNRMKFKKAPKKSIEAFTQEMRIIESNISKVVCAAIIVPTSTPIYPLRIDAGVESFLSRRGYFKSATGLYCREEDKRAIVSQGFACYTNSYLLRLTDISNALAKNILAKSP